MDAKQLIKELGLLPHPEGGWYRETFRANENIQVDANRSRSISTTIYYLLEDHDKSLFHRIRSDEFWFFHQGEPLEIYSIRAGELQTDILGNNIEQGERPQVLIPANTWFAARLKSGSGYSLVSCVVAPGFDFADFELAKRTDLIQEYPELREIIEIFTESR